MWTGDAHERAGDRGTGYGIGAHPLDVHPVAVAAGGGCGGDRAHSGRAALVFDDAPAQTRQLFVSVATFAVVWAAITALVFRWQGVTLAPDGLHVHSLRPRTIPWADIAWLSTQRLLGATYVIVWEASGRWTRLRAPTTGLLAWDRDFEDKCRTIGTWQQAMR